MLTVAKSRKYAKRQLAKCDLCFGHATRFEMLWTVLHKGPRGRLAATSVKSPGPSSSPVTIAAIVEAAAKRVGQQDEVASLNAALQSNGVQFAWQLERLSDRDWD